MNTSDLCILRRLMDDVDLRDLLDEMSDYAIDRSIGPDVLPRHVDYWLDCAKALRAAQFRIKEET